MLMRFFLVLAVFLNSLTCSAVNVSANASNLNKALVNSSRVYPQVGSATPTSPLKLVYQIGEFAQGGVVIWVTNDRQHGLVASIVNLGPTTGSHPYTLAWGPMNVQTNATRDNPLPTFYTNTTPKENYSGYQNQKKILELDPNLSDYPAFAACANYSIKIGDTTYNDWFLPSLQELNQIYNLRDTVSKVSEANGGKALFTKPTDPGLSSYWSSREDEDYSSSAWLLFFFYGSQSNDSKGHSFRCALCPGFLTHYQFNNLTRAA